MTGIWVIMAGYVTLEAKIDNFDIPLKILGPSSTINYYKMRELPAINRVSARA